MRFPIFLLVLISIFSCSEEQNDTTVFSSRPYEPFVFRSVLDEQPRMITMALHDDLWAAYHTQEASLYKIWKGRVNFDGAVYTTAHGPQPTSIGDAYFENQFKNPWLVTGPTGDTIIPTIDYKGHRIIEGQAQLVYHLVAKDYTIKIKETVEALEGENNQIVFQRDFETTMPSVLRLYLRTNVNSIVLPENIDTDGVWEIISKEVKKIKSSEALDVIGNLQLNRGKTKFYITLMDKPVVENPMKNKYMDEDKDELHPGARLIAKSDCKSCHNKKVKTIGPSYLAIANKYADTDDNMEILINKVKKGGGGVWGSQVMTAHPEYSITDIKEMVTYILTLGDPKNGGGASGSGDVKSLMGVDVNIGDLIPGAVTRVFKVPESINKIPSFKNKKPFQAGIMPNFDNIADNDFGDLVEFFALDAKGYLEIPEDGKYKFRIWSDDGTRVTLGDEEILNHDGPHGTSYKESEYFLKKGFYPFYLEFFQGVGGKFLSWNYRPENATEWKVIPPEMISHDIKDHDLIGTLNLPMSVSSKNPGDQAKLESVHPSFKLSQARPDVFTPKVGGLDFLSDGRLVISTWDAAGNVYVIDQRNKADHNDITYKKIASGLAEPLGLKVVNDDIYVMQKQEMTKLVDTDGDDIIDEYITLCDDWGVSANFHEFGFGLEEKDGWLYANLATGIQPGGASVVDQPKDRGSAIRVNIETGKFERLAHGLRTPNGVGKGYNGDIFISDNEGDWLPSSKIIHLRKGDWYGSRNVDFEGTANLNEVKPVVWLPQDEIGNSPTQMVGINFGPYKNQMLHGDVYHGGLKRVFVEEVAGQLQGAVFRFTQGLEAGINRLQWGPDKALYIGGVGNPGNWGQTQKLWYGLQKLELTGEAAFEMLAVRAKTNGVEIEFTENLSGDDGWNPADFEIKQWYYLPTVNYGGPKMDEQSLPVKSATRNEQGNKVFLEIPGLKENHVVYIRLRNNYVGHKNHSLWATEAWYTLNNIPVNDLGIVKTSPVEFKENSLTASEKNEGWDLLFDGQTMSEWHNYNKGKMESPSKWQVTPDGTIHFNPKANGTGGDIVSNKEYENFELSLDWKISNCGNSGIFYNVVEDSEIDNAYKTAIEMQVLDNVCHPDTKLPTHQAGDLYDLKAADPVTVKPAGQWNEARIIVDNLEVQFWLNGHRVVDFTMFDEEWDRMVAKSKFADWPHFAKTKKGKIALQDHGDKVWYRNIKIREI